MANHSGEMFHALHKRYNRMGWLLGPMAHKITNLDLHPEIPVAYDNDAFSAYSNKKAWDELAWVKMMEDIKRRELKAEFVLAPDTVGDPDETLRKFFAYRYLIPKHCPVFFAAQDGMGVRDIPSTVDGVFIGGSLKYKWRMVSSFTNAFKRVHCGRVNNLSKLLACERLGVESVDGTHWFRFRSPEEWGEDIENFFLHKLTPQRQQELFYE